MFLLKDYGEGNGLTEVEHNQFSEDFLKDEFHLFCVERTETNGVFDFTESGFNAPTEGIEALDFEERETDRVKVGDDGFRDRIGDGKTNDSEGEVIENIVRTSFQTDGEEIKSFILKDFTLISVQRSGISRLASGKVERERHIKGNLLRERKTGSDPHSIPNTEKEKPALFLNMGEAVVGFITSVSYNEGIADVRSVNHANQRNLFIFFMNTLNEGIHEDMVFQIIHSIDVMKVIWFFSVLGSKVGIRIIGITGGFQYGAVNSKYAHGVQIELGIDAVCEHMEQGIECLRENCRALLNEGGGCRHGLAYTEKLPDFFVQRTAPECQNGVDILLKRQLPGSRIVFPRTNRVEPTDAGNLMNRAFQSLFYLNGFHVCTLPAVFVCGAYFHYKGHFHE